MNKRVVITGLGTLSPVGNDVPTLWENIASGVSGVDYITDYDTEGYRSKIAAQVKGFNGKSAFGRKEARRMDRFTQLGLAAALQAVEDSRLEISDSNRDRIGVVVGTGIGGMGTMYENMLTFINKGPSRVSPFMVPMMLPDTAAGTIAIQLGVRGPNMAVITACATGTNAVGEAAEVIRRGAADVILAGGTEAAVVPVAMAALGVMTALSSRNDDPQSASRPFDLERDGFVMGEGSAVLVLESLEHAIARQAPILAEISGYGSTSDAYHITAPAEHGDGAALCMQIALASADFSINQIDYINAHGTSTQLNDKSETAAIKTVFGERAYDIPISSTKSMTGHLLGASGALEALICVKILESQLLPPTINYEHPDPTCDLDYVPNTARQATVRHIMSNSFGFGGHNATIILSQYTEQM